MAYPEKFRVAPVRFAEVPKGEELAKKTISLAFQALKETYPMLGQKPYRDRIPDIGSIVFEPLVQVQEAEEAEMPKDTLLNKTFTELDILNGGRYQRRVTKNEPIFWNPDAKRKMMHIANNYLQILSLPDQTMRSDAAFLLGILIQLKTFASLPIAQELKDKIVWKEMAREYLHLHLIDKTKSEAGEKNMLNQEKLKEIQQAIESFVIDSPNVQFTAHGARVVVRLPDETVMHAAFAMGEEFNMGIIQLLTEPAQEKFLEFMENNLIVRRERLVVRRTSSKAQAQNTLGYLDETGLKNDRNALLEAFAFSLIPAYLHDSTAKGQFLNPWQYPA